MTISTRKHKKTIIDKKNNTDFFVMLLQKKYILDVIKIQILDTEINEYNWRMLN